jgi:hypothetical protein
MPILFRRKYLRFSTFPYRMPVCQSLLVAAYPGMYNNLLCYKQLKVEAPVAQQDRASVS